MPSIDSTTITARVSNKAAAGIQQLCDLKGLTRSALINDMVERELTRATQAALGVSEPEPVEELPEAPNMPERLYSSALSLVDDMLTEGYPESEILLMLAQDRERML